MKNLIITTALMLTATAAWAQKVKESEVPEAVITSFRSNFKEAKVEKWEKEKDGSYEAEFDLNKTETSASFSADGKLIETETEINTSELPKGVSDYITKNYPGYKNREAARITDAAGKVSYEAEVKKGKEEMDLTFDVNGNFLKKVVEKADNDDKK
ncbi:MAG: PepSY-like domain-containing protein [Bacteroidia bacterium]